MYYYVKENPTKLYYERHPLLVEHAKSASLARKVHIWRALLMSSRSRTVVATVGFFAAAIMALCLLLVAKPANAATFTVDRNDDPDPANSQSLHSRPLRLLVARRDSRYERRLRGGRHNLGGGDLHPE